MTTMTTVLCGGVGAARFLRGLLEIMPGAVVTAVVNTADDTVLHGLSISPDLDTITYTLAGAIDAERGWGLGGETWRAMEALGRYLAVRPAGSTAAPTWFNLGDADLATHLYRTARLDEGATLTEVSGEIARAWGLDLKVLPISDDRLRTMVTLAPSTRPDGADRAGVEVTFQDYFVRLRHGVPVRSVRFDHDGAAPTPQALEALAASEVVVIAPSNPIVSIGPIRALPGVDERLTARRESVVAVSPIVGGAALKGPADRMLVELGLEPSVVGVARLYSPVAATLVVDTADAEHAEAVEAVGMRCVVTPTVMAEPGVGASLAAACLAAGRSSGE
jgi:LPPG:FO 2-phospho-L-lactate transferase